MFEAINTKESFAKREERVLQFWQDNAILPKSIAQREGGPLFSHYDGPPFATGLPHYGHLLAGTIKDVVLRYKTMKGYYVPRRIGWDCHGLPVENEIEKAFNLSGAASIEAFGIAAFNEECRKIVLRYTSEWKKTTLRMGRFVDFDTTYRTMDLPFMESVWWVFQSLYKKGLIYEGYKVMPFSAKLGTPLSNFEASENYKDVDDPSLTVAIELLGEENTFVLVWTTTPWTLVSNMAITVGAEIDYVMIQESASSKKYILARQCLDRYFKDSVAYQILNEYSGKALVGKRYKPLFPHFQDYAMKGAFHIIADGFVTIDEGTGLVHTAPAFGEADFYACEKHKIPLVCPVDQNGQFTNAVPEFVGRFVKDCDKDIIKMLKDRGSVFRHENCRHRYPFCWRSDTPLIYKVVATWFVAVEKIKDKILNSNEQIYWMPEHIKYGRFGKWLEGARDWAISRNRYWGTPIPIWRADDGEIVVFGSKQELEDATSTKIQDLHRHFIDELTFTKNGKLFRRIPEVFDCWFESGSMPYAEQHYPFENETHFRTAFPADFIAEGLDQTRGWFYTLTVLATALFEKPAFKNVIVNGIILAADGNKMSKRLKNYPDPQEVIDIYGADSIRLYMLSSPAVKADDLCFSKPGVELVLRHVLLPLWNAYSFFITYARLNSWEAEAIDPTFTPQAAIDRWMLSLVHKLIHDVEGAMDRYDLSHAVHPFVDFIDQLTNWYIRRSRRRFWSDEATRDRHEAHKTLYTVLVHLVKIAAPYVPFIAEEMYLNLRLKTNPESVHLTHFPQYVASERDLFLEEVMATVQRAVSLGHSLRKEKQLKVRQPLARAFIISANRRNIELLEQEKQLIADELNVQEVVFSTDESGFVRLQAKPNFRLLGKKIGKLMKQAHAAIDAFSQEELNKIMQGGTLTLILEGQQVVLLPEDVAVERIVKEDLVAANSEDITVALDTALTPELISVGIAREFVNRVNTLRKEKNFNISDRIHLTVAAPAEIEQALKAHEAFIASEILALSLTFAPNDGDVCDINEQSVRVEILRPLASSGL